MVRTFRKGPTIKHLKRSQIIQLEEYFEGHHQEKSQEYLVSPFRDLLHYREV